MANESFGFLLRGCACCTVTLYISNDILCIYSILYYPDIVSCVQDYKGVFAMMKMNDNSDHFI